MDTKETRKRSNKKGKEQSHFGTMLSILQECLLTHRWNEAGKIISSMCLYSCIPSDVCVGKGMPSVELIWKCGLEVLYHHPDCTHDDVTQFHSKRHQLDTKVSKYQCHLEHAFYLMTEHKLEKAYDVVKQKSAPSKLNSVYPQNSSQCKYEKCTLQSQWRDLIDAYTGLIAYMMWYQTGAERNPGKKAEAEKYWELATKNLGQILDKPGVWDIFISKHIELLCSRGMVTEAVNLAEKYRDENPTNPNAHKYLYHLLKRQDGDSKRIIQVLKDIIDRIPSDELVLDYVDTLRQDSKHCHQVYLPPLFTMLDYACWKNNIRPWTVLADRLRSIHTKKSVLGVKTMMKCWRNRQDWWIDYHFHNHHAVDMAKQDKLLAVEKAIVAVFLLGPDCIFVEKIIKYFYKRKKRKSAKKINHAKELYQFQESVD